MSLTYEIKDFRNEDNQKFVGFMITDEKQRVFVIDKRVDLVDGKTDEQYIQDAIALAQDEINEWKDSFALIGRKFNPETGGFE